MSESKSVVTGTGKENEDGLIGGKLVSPADHLRVMKKHRQAAANAKISASVVSTQETAKKATK